MAKSFPVCPSYARRANDSVSASYVEGFGISANRSPLIAVQWVQWWSEQRERPSRAFRRR